MACSRENFTLTFTITIIAAAAAIFINSGGGGIVHVIVWLKGRRLYGPESKRSMSHTILGRTLKGNA
jgi:hypothetical protein